MPRMARLGPVALIALIAATPLPAQDEHPTLPDGAAAAGDPWNSTEIAAPDLHDRPLKRSMSKSGSPVILDAGSRGTNPWVRTVASLAGVVALIFLLAWGYKAVTGGRLPLLAKTKRPGLIEVIERAALSPRQSVCLVRVGTRLVLVGITNGSLNALDVIDDPETVADLRGQAAMRKPDSHVRQTSDASPDFQRCLEHEASSYDPPLERTDERGGDQDAGIIDLKRRLAGTIERIRARVSRA